MKQTKTAIALATALTLGACATDDPNRRAKIGAGVGALVGAVIGNQVDDKNGKYVGAVVGALAGAGVGNYMDKQQAELERQLAAEAARDELRITQLAGDALRVGVASDATFGVDSAQLKPESTNTYAKIANVLKSYDKTVVHVVGHADSTGDNAYNLNLSARRANSVAAYLQSQGLPVERVRTEGRGENEPVASNDTANGRSRNRRVDIVIKPVVEGNEQQAWTPPPYLGS